MKRRDFLRKVAGAAAGIAVAPLAAAMLPRAPMLTLVADDVPMTGMEILARQSGKLTNFAALDAQAKMIWSKSVWEAAREPSFFNSYMMGGPNAAIQRITELPGYVPPPRDCGFYAARHKAKQMRKITRYAGGGRVRYRGWAER